MEPYVRSFASPDEVIEIETVRSEMITHGGMTVSHDIQQPGWRWSEHVAPLVGAEWCQVRHIGIARAIEHPERGRQELVGQAVELNRTPWALRTTAPEKGADTDSVLGALGYDAAAIAGLRDRGVI